MEDHAQDSIPLRPHIKATLRLGLEEFSVSTPAMGLLSEQLAAMKQESMNILKNFITQHNVPNEVPDENVESSSGDETVEIAKPPERPKKRK